jgi:hypothetical protein
MHQIALALAAPAAITKYAGEGGWPVASKSNNSKKLSIEQTGWRGGGSPERPGTSG